MSKKKYYIIYYVIRDGGFEYGDKFLLNTTPEKLLLDTEEHLKEFFGEFEKEGDDYTDGERALRLGRCHELTKEEYKVLNKY